ncbi:ScbA/BarX family gamma-butyrolactone biosynthesis protein [Streptomyces sp. NPDC002766]|uniref:ScbA/BarX family gamma-butyrolactone biosynthesis protein n=1 Tax=Streptomyces sp. NPDC002766 TaxID=3154429 RepID=UPI00331D067E
MSVSTYRTTRVIPGMTHPQDPGAPAGGAPAFQPLTSTVPKELVHRASVAEVMLTDWARRGDHHFALAAQWPRGHSFFTAVDGCHDPLIAAETIRQTGLLLAHAEYAVPLGHHFLVSNLNVAVRPAHIRVAATPASLELDVRCHDIKQRRGELTGLRIDVALHRDGHLAATGGGTLTCIPPKVYQRLRATHSPTGTGAVLPLTAPEPPQRVGRMSPTDVVLSPIGHPHRWQLRVDTRHPALFDHPLDHVPGMLLIEAARQATTHTLGHTTLPHTLTSQFLHYVELDTPCTIQAFPLPTTGTGTGTGPGGNRTVHITARQNQTDVFHCTLTTTPPQK